MNELRCALLSDGSSDRALIPVIYWLLREKLPSTAINVDWADLRRLSSRSNGLAARIQKAIDYYPCDILFVHRDSERELRQTRAAEIAAAVQGISLKIPYVCVVPVRMQEAWLLIDEVAIRSAAGNPNGAVSLSLPRIQGIEKLPDPKATLNELLRTASELKGRRLKQFAASASAFRVAELIEDWQPLRKLAAFSEFESEIDQVLAVL